MIMEETKQIEVVPVNGRFYSSEMIKYPVSFLYEQWSEVYMVLRKVNPCSPDRQSPTATDRTFSSVAADRSRTFIYSRLIWELVLQSF